MFYKYSGTAATVTITITSSGLGTCHPSFYACPMRSLSEYVQFHGVRDLSGESCKPAPRVLDLVRNVQNTFIEHYQIYCHERKAGTFSGFLADKSW